LYTSEPYIIFLVPCACLYLVYRGLFYGEAISFRFICITYICHWLCPCFKGVSSSPCSSGVGWIIHDFYLIWFEYLVKLYIWCDSMMVICERRLHVISLTWDHRDAP
jgi:hypothetical protein